MTFDDLTLAEVETIQAEALGGKTISEADGLAVAGAVLWMVARKNGEAGLTWDEFKNRVTMRELREASKEMQALADPT